MWEGGGPHNDNLWTQWEEPAVHTLGHIGGASHPLGCSLDAAGLWFGSNTMSIHGIMCKPTIHGMVS